MPDEETREEPEVEVEGHGIPPGAAEGIPPDAEGIPPGAHDDDSDDVEGHMFGEGVSPGGVSPGGVSPGGVTPGGHSGG